MATLSGTSYRQASYYHSQTGVTTSLGNYKVKSYYVSKTDTLKRVKPVDLFANGTAYSVVAEFYSSGNDTVWSVGLGNGFYGRYQAPVSYHISQGVLPHSVTSDSEVASMRAILRNKILSKARARGTNLANMLGEYRQTASLFGDCATKVATMIAAVVRKDPRILVHGHYYPNGIRKAGVPLRESKRLFREYLAFVYGVKPLAQDVADLYLHFKERALVTPLVDQFSEYTGRRAETTVPFTGSSSLKGTESRKWHSGVRAVAKVAYSNLSLKASLGRFGMTNPASVAWELTPGSFVLDWWFNVGEFLESLDNCIYIDGSASKILYTTKRRFDSVASILGSEAKYSNDARGRLAPTSLGTLATMHYKKSVSAQHIANGLALIGLALSNKAISLSTAERQRLKRRIL